MIVEAIVKLQFLEHEQPEKIFLDICPSVELEYLPFQLASSFNFP